MESIKSEFSIRQNTDGLFNLVDIVNNIIKSKNVNSYMDKIKNKVRDTETNIFHILENQFIELLKKGKNKNSKKAIKILFPEEEKENISDENLIDLLNENFLFEGKKINVIQTDAEIYFKAKDIATVLEYSSLKESIKTNVDAEDKIIYKELIKRIPDCDNKKICKEQPHTIFINKSGLQSFLVKSRMIKSIELAKLLDINIFQKYTLKETCIIYYISLYLDSKKILYKTQKKVEKYRMDLYLPLYNINIEIDEDDHKYRCPVYEKSRENNIFSNLNCTILRFNPDDKNTNIFNFIAKISDVIEEKNIILKDRIINNILLENERLKLENERLKLENERLGNSDIIIHKKKIENLNYKQKITTNISIDNTEQSIVLDKKKCIDCNIEIKKNSTRCNDCQNKKKFLENKYNRPSYESLIDDLKIMPYTKVGAKYNVSDNAIRKWIKTYEKYL